MCLIGSLLTWHTDGLNALHDSRVVTLLLALAANRWDLNLVLVSVVE